MSKRIRFWTDTSKRNGMTEYQCTADVGPADGSEPEHIVGSWTLDSNQAAKSLLFSLIDKLINARRETKENVAIILADQVAQANAERDRAIAERVTTEDQLKEREKQLHEQVRTTGIVRFELYETRNEVHDLRDKLEAGKVRRAEVETKLNETVAKLEGAQSNARALARANEDLRTGVDRLKREAAINNPDNYRVGQAGLPGTLMRKLQVAKRERDEARAHVERLEVDLSATKRGRNTLANELTETRVELFQLRRNIQAGAASTNAVTPEALAHILVGALKPDVTDALLRELSNKEGPQS